uniref:Uncharacterized protein n=1 Tax=Peronospora matthiolae TaxID=2874970 RepID=A0AAV1V0H7_9STRA
MVVFTCFVDGLQVPVEKLMTGAPWRSSSTRAHERILSKSCSRLESRPVTVLGNDSGGPRSPVRMEELGSIDLQATEVAATQRCLPSPDAETRSSPSSSISPLVLRNRLRHIATLATISLLLHRDDAVLAWIVDQNVDDMSRSRAQVDTALA